ncbi:ABC transporter substrate-binding protein [Acaryochloris marina]|nr:ABC transporter substrate-binding protein [Acaryochloris marina]
MVVACQKDLDVRTPSTPSQQEDCRMIEHQQGATQICGQPQHIAVLGPFVLEPLLALDIQPFAYADHVAWHQDAYNNPSQDIPYLGEFVTQPLTNLGLASQPAIETLLKTKPDLIIGTDFNNADQYQMLSKVAPTLLLVNSGNTRLLQAFGDAEF